MQKALKYQDYTGQKFGHWTAIRFVELRGKPSSHQRPMWLCRCDCGREQVTNIYTVLRGYSWRCLSCSKTKHGKVGTALYATWAAMIARCYKTYSNRYKYYGARGIVVCDEWHDAATFFKWACGNGYEKGLTIERIDNNGNYCPENCTWIPREQQSANKSNAALLTANGETKHLTEWAEAVNISPATIRSRLHKGQSPEEAVGPSLLDRRASRVGEWANGKWQPKNIKHRRSA